MNWIEILGASEFPDTWEEILQHRAPIYRFLSETDQRELKSYIRWFIASKPFEGCGGLVITDEIRVIVASQACLLLLHRETPCYERLRLIRIYPGAYFTKNSTNPVLGESWPQGVVLLAWDSARGGAANPFDGDNVVMHEFAHQLDQEDGQTDGTPLLGRGLAESEQAGLYTAWARMLSKEFDDFRLHLEKGNKTVMDQQGGSDPAEFFAVATECFYEKPKQLSKRCPGLYAALRDFYRQDPASWPRHDGGASNKSLQTATMGRQPHNV